MEQDKSQKEIVIAKSAGFCYGVKRAINKIEEKVKIAPTYTTAPIVHNDKTNQELKRKGLYFVDSIEEVPKGASIVVRAHGIPKNMIKEYINKGLNIVDATCPNVKKIHNIVEEYSQKGYEIVIIGDKEHAEVKGIIGWIEGKYDIVSSTNDIKKYEKACIVTQTTVNVELAKNLIEEVKNNAMESVVFNTACMATYERQNEAVKIAKSVDTFIVIGDEKSANSCRLYEITKERCNNTYFIKDENDLKNINIVGEKIGITAGASTSKSTIDAVVLELRGKQEAMKSL